MRTKEEKRRDSYRLLYNMDDLVDCGTITRKQADKLQVMLLCTDESMVELAINMIREYWYQQRQNK